MTHEVAVSSDTTTDGAAVGGGHDRARDVGSSVLLEVCFLGQCV